MPGFRCLTNMERTTLAEACYLAIEYLDGKIEMHGDYSEEDVRSMEREILEYHTLANRLLDSVTPPPGPFSSAS